MLAVLILSASGLVATQSMSCVGALITQTDVEILEKYSRQAHSDNDNTDLMHGVVKISRDIELPYSFSITSKGNGTLEFPRISFRIYDAHNDGVTFRPYLLCVQLKDVNNDGYADIVITGIADHWDENIDDKLVSSNPVSAVYLYDPNKSTFIAKNVSDEISYWMGNTFCSGMKCETN